VISQRIHAAPNGYLRTCWLTLSVVLNLGLLGVFKYFNFFADSLTQLFSFAGFALDAGTLHIVLPVGISFYTFQTMSYTIDVYRKELEPCRSLIDFFLYVSFFPQLVAGPIERGKHFLPQIQHARTVELNDLRTGLGLIVIGYFKKVFVADNCAVLADRVFDSSEPVSGILFLLGVYAFAWQIYGDFSGYTDIARGVAKTMGFDIMVNFRMPYFSSNPRDFWQRWHISLSTWLRDYLYIPLGGNRLSEKKCYRNLMVTMTLGGLWHGAAFTFVIWGVLHGFILCAHRKAAQIFGWALSEGGRTKSLKHAVQVVLFFHFICLTWVFFRAPSVQDAWHLVSTVQGLGLADLSWCRLLFFFIGPLLLLDLYNEVKNTSNAVLEMRGIYQGVILGLMTGAIVLCGNFDATPFIYFQF